MQPIEKKDRESFNSLLRRFKKQSRDTVMEFRKREYYIKPSEIRNRQNEMKKHIKRKLKQQEREREIFIKSKKRKGYRY